MRLSNTILFISLFVSFSAQAATYQLTFSGVWNSSQVEPGNFPSAAHFTELVGATHIAGSPLWEPGQLASRGIEDVAELGNSNNLQIEVAAGINSGIYGEFIEVGGLSQFPVSQTATFDIFDDKPEVSLISMIAPSPDWFVGVYSLSLKDQNGWVDDLTVDLKAWDAGTESGTAFDLFNTPTLPQSTISRRFAPFVDDPVIGQLRFELISETTPVPLPASIWLFFASCAALNRYRLQQS